MDYEQFKGAVKANELSKSEIVEYLDSVTLTSTQSESYDCKGFVTHKGIIYGFNLFYFLYTDGYYADYRQNNGESIFEELDSDPQCFKTRREAIEYMDEVLKKNKLI